MASALAPANAPQANTTSEAALPFGLGIPVSDLATTTITITVAGNATSTCSIAAPGYTPVTAAADANGTAACTLIPTAPAAEEAPAA